MTKPTVTVSSDYAYLGGREFRAYYGYEYADIAEDAGDSVAGWGFEAVFGDKKVRIPAEKLGIKDEFDVVDGLLTGIGWLFAKYHLEEG